MMLSFSLRRARRPVVAIAVAAALAVPLAGGTAAYAYAGDVPRGTTVLGIDLGGHSTGEAERAMRDALARRDLAAPVTVSVAGRTVALRPAEIGLAVDVAATVERAAASTGPLAAVFGRERAVDPVVTVDAGRLGTALKLPAATVTRAAVAPAVTFDGLTPKPVYPVAGRGLHAERAAAAVAAGWLRRDVIDLPLAETVPAMTRADVDRVVAEMARPAVAGAVTVQLPGAAGTLSVPPRAIARSLVLTGDAGGRINPRVDEARLRAALADALTEVERQPRAAVVDGTVVASTGGTVVDTAALARDLLGALPDPAPRRIAGTLRQVPAQPPTGELARQGVREPVSSFTTRFSGGLSSPRSHNIVTVANEVDGAVVRPGETFSLNGYTGPRGYPEGYRDAPVILGGKLVPGVGGGISQFTTTLFNATYYAGLQDVFHQPHGYYFSRYPSVIESTIFYPDLDFKFRNDSPHAVLVDTSYTEDSVTVSIWGTKRYDVSTEWSPRRDVVTPQIQRLPKGPSCIATEGSEGFTQDAWRIFRDGGKEVRREKFTWRYDAEPRFICE